MENYIQCVVIRNQLKQATNTFYLQMTPNYYAPEQFYEEAKHIKKCKSFFSRSQLKFGSKT